jgi:Ca2+-binding EF-hand superfamily protein
MSPVKVTRPMEEVSEMLIRFRRLLWGQLFRIYIKYDTDGNGHMDNEEMTKLLKELLNETSKSELDYVFKNGFRMDLNGDKNFVFEEFVSEHLNSVPFFYQTQL